MSTFTFNCSGNGTHLSWIVDGYSTGSLYALNKGIWFSDTITSPDGHFVSSQLLIPQTKANSNITVKCTVINASYTGIESSEPIKLLLQGMFVVVFICIYLMFAMNTMESFT